LGTIQTIGHLSYGRASAEKFGSKRMMQEILRWMASLCVTGSGLVIAARVRPLLMGWAFVGLSVGSLSWIVVGYLSTDYALLAQNFVITLINTVGIYRWLIWKGKV
jgi:hypothetical protein